MLRGGLPAFGRSAGGDVGDETGVTRGKGTEIPRTHAY